jgi:CheY-like chemotaxis protein
MARVLVVEDNVELAAMIEQVLELGDHDVLIARDGQSAIDIARLERPDLVLMDVMLPIRSGLDVTRLIRSEPDRTLASVPIIAMSASANLRVVAESGEFTSVLPKPFDIDTLIAIVDIHTSDVP